MRSHLPMTTTFFQFKLPLPLVTLKGIGWQLIRSHDYIWDGRIRKEEHCLFQYTISGRGELEYNGRMYKLEEGQAFITEIPGEHCYRLPANSPEWEILFLEFSMHALPYWRQLLSMNGPVLSLPKDSILHQYMWNMYDISFRDQIHHVFESSKYAYQFVMELLCFVYDNQTKHPLTPKIELCKQFIESNYYQPIGLEEIASAVQLSKYHLTRDFEKKVGISPIHYLTEVRLEQSTKLLLATSDNLDSIAKSVGFSSANYFVRVFKKYMGVSPTEFRKKRSTYEVSRVLFK